MTYQNLSPSRRNLLKGVAGVSALPFVGAFIALQSQQSRAANGATALVDSPYGAIRPVADMTTGLPLLQLPPGFTYKSFGWRGDTMANGMPCPGGHDGMGVVVARKVGRSSELVLVRNHEIGATSAGNFINAPGVYDNGTSTATTGNKFGGGTTNLVFRDGNWLSMTPSLGGTQTNCAGGITPWGTWLTCEEVGSDAVSASGRKHGYVFEVNADPARTTGLPIIGMGRFAHEAGYRQRLRDRRQLGQVRLLSLCAGHQERCARFAGHGRRAADGEGQGHAEREPGYGATERAL